jgi:hypothetical protein
MGADHIVHLECAPKSHFGDGDSIQGTLAILSMLKARDRGNMIAELAKRDGKPVEEMSVTVVVRRDGKEEQQQVTHKDLMAQAAPLEAHAANCRSCPANVTNEPYGCFGFVRYPISRAAEEWLMKKVQPADSPGGEILLRAIDDLGYDGSPMAGFRANGLLESDEPLAIDIGGAEIESDQIFQALFQVGTGLQPSHCMMILVWLGVLSLDQARSGDFESLNLGPAPSDGSAGDLWRLLRALAFAVRNDVPLLVDA